jgi:hypothetical protein
VDAVDEVDEFSRAEAAPASGPKAVGKKHSALGSQHSAP